LGCLQLQQKINEDAADPEKQLERREFCSTINQA